MRSARECHLALARDLVTTTSHQVFSAPGSGDRAGLSYSRLGSYTGAILIVSPRPPAPKGPQPRKSAIGTTTASCPPRWIALYGPVFTLNAARLMTGVHRFYDFGTLSPPLLTFRSCSTGHCWC